MNKFPYILCFVAVGMVGALTFVFGAPTATHAAITQKSGTTTSGLVGWWPFDEGTSTIAGDFSSNKNNGTLTNSPVWTSGKRGRALQFDGASNYVIANNPVNFNSNYSVTFWVYFNSIAGYGLFGNAPGNPPLTGGAGNSNNIYLNPNGTVGYFVFDGVGKNLTSTTTLSAGRWYQVSVTHDATNSIRRLYIDGRLEHQDSFLTIQSFSKVVFSFNRSETNYFTGPLAFINGKMDDVKIYNRALSATDISALHKSGEVVRKTTDKTGLVGYWSFDEGTSTIAASFSGTTNNGTLLNFASPPTADSGWTALGKKGKALIFDGIDDYFSLAQPNVQVSPNVFTVSGWINPDSQYARFLTPNSNGIDQWIGYDAVNQRLELTITEIADVNNRGRASTVNSVPLNRWTHWAVSINDKDIKIYINGVLDSSYTEVINIGAWSGSWTIGQRGNASSYYKGKMDDLRVYNRILSADEIQALYKSNQTLINAPQDKKLTNGLVGYWTFNGKDVGTTIVDVTGQGNNGYVQNVSTSSMLTIGKVGQGASFNGSNSYITAGTGPNNIATNAVTVSAWVYPNNTGSIMTVVSNDRDCGGCGSYMGFGMQIYYGGTSMFRIWNSDGTGPRAAATVTNPPANEWSFLTGTFDGSTVKYYMNGVLLNSTGAVGNGTLGTPSSFQTKIGQLGCCGGTHTMNGKIDEVRIYNRALSLAEIKQLYSMGR